LLNGARKKESSNRMVKLDNPWNRDTSSKNNIWVSLLYYWSKKDCLDYIERKGVERNPVAKAMHRSGECMCGTMQSVEARKMASALYPESGEWLDELEQKVFDKGFYWGWGEATTKESREFQKRMGQMEFPFMCTDCMGKGQGE
jgi:3'-phosphoadenosine 5'-phosphosulfate sulfotransferase (PAPS reductase)/FAD synthetase